MSTTRPYAADDRGGPEAGGSAGATGTTGATEAGRPAGGVEGTDGATMSDEAAGAADGSSGAWSVTGHRGPHAEEQDPVRRLTLSGESGIVPRARDFTRQALRDWGWLPAATADRRAAAEDVLLVVSELVTNACLHAGGPEELTLRRHPKALRMEVVDGGGGDPAPRTPHRSGRPGGHGMFIVQRLCLDWGVVRHGDRPGKTVWAELAAPS